MSKRFLLTENEINEIRGLYGLINEVAKAINASTSPERMPNFIGQGNKNSSFGLKGDANQENFYFKSTIGDLVNKSTGDTKMFLSGFQPATDAGQYVDYVRVGTTELTNKGSISFDLSKLPAETEVLATHNGLLVLRRMMDQLGGSKNGKVTLSMSAEQRASGQKTFDLNNISSRIPPNLATIASALSVLLIPEAQRANIKDGYAIDNFVGKTNEQIIQAINTTLKRGLVGVFLTPEDSANIDKIISDKKLVTTLDLSVFESMYGKGTLDKTGGSITEAQINSVWNSFKKSYKDTLISNFTAYLDNEFKYLANNLSKIMEGLSISTLWYMYTKLRDTSTLGPKSGVQTNTKTQTSQTYQMGK
jgi:hypothetical protein